MIGFCFVPIDASLVGALISLYGNFDLSFVLTLALRILSHTWLSSHGGNHRFIQYESPLLGLYFRDYR